MQNSLPHTRRRWLGQALGAASTLALPAWTRHAAAQDTPRFALGIASGTPRADSVVLWTRLTGDKLPEKTEVRWEMAHDEAFTRIAARGVHEAVADEVHTVHATAAGLDPAHGYWYRFEALGQRSRAGFTRTAPRADAVVEKLDFTIASCQRFEHGHYAAWRDVAERPPELVLFLGDYIYEYAAPANALRKVSGPRTETLDAYRQRYAEYKADAQLQAAHAVAPWIVIWDDHEVENDYAGLQGERLQWFFDRQRAAAYRAWWEHMPLPQAMKPIGPDLRIYGSLDWGRLARIHWLDDRQYRDVQVCPRPGRGGSAIVARLACPEIAEPKRTLLGAEQEKWLAANWSGEHRWNLLAQQTLMARLSHAPVMEDGKPAGRYWTDGWDGYPGARQRLLQTLAERKVPGPLVVGGDVHANFAADLLLDFDDPKGAIVATEFCGTSISSNGGAQDWLDKARPFNPHLHHARSDERGTVRFTMQRERTEVELRVVADVRDAASRVNTGERFAVEAARPGVRRA